MKTLRQILKHKHEGGKIGFWWLWLIIYCAMYGTAITIYYLIKLLG